MSLDKRIDEYIVAGCPLARELAVLRTYCSCRADDEAVDEAMEKYLQLQNPDDSNLFA